MLRSLQSAATEPATIALIVNALGNLGLLAHERGDHDLAVAQLEQSIRFAEGIGDKAGAWHCRPYLAEALRNKGDYDRARSLGESTLQLLEGDGDRRGLGLMLMELGSIATAQRDFPTAYENLQRSLRLNQEFGELSGIAFVFDRFAVLAAAQGQYERALCLTGAAAVLREQLGTPPPPAIQRQMMSRSNPRGVPSADWPRRRWPLAESSRWPRPSPRRRRRRRPRRTDQSRRATH